jgi:hypothetical protein
MIALSAEVGVVVAATQVVPSVEVSQVVVAFQLPEPTLRNMRGITLTPILSMAKLGRAPAPLTSLAAHLSWTTAWLSQAAGRVIVFVWEFWGVVTPLPV